MINVNDYIYYVHVVEKKGFSSAERALGIPKSRLSRHIRQLEERLGVRLIQRNSRRFVVTEIGHIFYQRARAALNEIEAAEAIVKRSREELSGDIRVTCSIGVAQFLMKNLITRFMDNHSGVNIAQYVTNANVNLIEEGFDLAIRGYEEALPDSSLIQRMLARVSWRLVAGPGYLERSGVPETPNDISSHSCLKVGSRLMGSTWKLEHKNEGQIIVAFTPRFCSDDMGTLIQAAKDGLGIVSLPEYVTRAEVDAGGLVYVLP